MKWIGVLLRICLGGVFLWSGAAKVRWLASTQVQSIPTMFSDFAELGDVPVYVLTGAEVILGAVLVAGVSKKWAPLVAIIILSAFSGLIAAELMKATPRPCGCLGAPAALSDPSVARYELFLSLLRNVLLISAATWLVLRHVVHPRKVSQTAPHAAAGAPA